MYSDRPNTIRQMAIKINSQANLTWLGNLHKRNLVAIYLHESPFGPVYTGSIKLGDLNGNPGREARNYIKISGTTYLG